MAIFANGVDKTLIVRLFQSIGSFCRWNPSMATAGELAGVVANALEIDPQLVNQVFRNLREAGLLTKGGRGPSAPHMSALDAARVLTALLVSERPVDAPAIARELGQFQLMYVGSGSNSLKVNVGDCFEANLASLLDALRDTPAAAGGASIEARMPDLFTGLRLRAPGADSEHRYEHPAYIAAVDPENSPILLEDAAALAPAQALSLGKRLAPSRISIVRRIDGEALASVASCLAGA